MNRRVLIAVGLVLVAVIILVVALVSFRLQQDSGDAATPVTTEDGTPLPPSSADEPPGSTGVQVMATMPPTVEVVVSIQTLPRGWQLTEAELTTDMRLATEVGDNVITNIQDAVGLYARTDIFQGETLTFDSLVVDPTILGVNEYGPSSLIPPGFLAAAVPMDRLSGVAYGLKAGDSVDIMLSFYFYQIDEQFQTYLRNAAVFFVEEVVEASEDTGEEGEAPAPANIVIIDQYGRFEELPTGDIAHIGPSEEQRPVKVSMILQNAKVIQVGTWSPPEAVQGPTPTPTPVENEDEVTPEAAQQPPTPTPLPDVMLVALSPQQQLFLKYAVESNADIDFALRNAQDSQLYSVENVDLNYLLGQFNIEVPPNFNFSVDTVIEEDDVTATPTRPAQEDTGEDS